MSKPKFVDTDKSRLFECHLYIVSVTTSRNGLIASYKAAKISLESPYLIAMVVTAIRERLTYFQVEEI